LALALGPAHAGQPAASAHCSRVQAADGGAGGATPPLRHTATLTSQSPTPKSTYMQVLTLTED